MCCGAIHWAGIPSVVFGCSAEMLAKIIGSDDFLFPCHEILANTTQPKVDVVGPLLEAEAVIVHEGFLEIAGTATLAVLRNHSSLVAQRLPMMRWAAGARSVQVTHPTGR